MRSHWRGCTSAITAISWKPNSRLPRGKARHDAPRRCSQADLEPLAASERLAAVRRCPLLPDVHSFLGKLDLSELRTTNAEVADEFFRRSLGDKVWEIPFLNGDGERGLLRVVLLFEFQSSIDSLMPLRIRGFAGLVQKAAFKDRALRKGDKLQPFLAIVVYNGVVPWTAERTVTGMVYRGPEAARRAA